MSNKNRGCCFWLCKCFYKKEQTNGSNEENRVNNIESGGYNNPIESNIEREDIIVFKMNELSNKFKVSTLVNKDEIKTSTEYNQTDAKFNCPICFKYYDHILKLSCCMNHICIFCADDYKTTHLKYNFNIKCPFCGYDKEGINLVDVTMNDPGKLYTDSPMRKVKEEIQKIVLNDIIIEKAEREEESNPHSER